MMTLTDTKSRINPGQKPEYWCDECGQPASFGTKEMGKDKHYCGFVNGRAACTAQNERKSA